MDSATFDRELQHRLELIESPDGPAVTVADLPLLDFVAALVGLLLVIGGLMWWAY